MIVVKKPKILGLGSKDGTKMKMMVHCLWWRCRNTRKIRKNDDGTKSIHIICKVL